MKTKGICRVALSTAIVTIGSLSNGFNARAEEYSSENPDNYGWEQTANGWKFVKQDGTYACNEFVEGWYLNSNGIQTGEQAAWDSDTTGEWYGDSTGWYAKDGTYTIDGKVCAFDSDGYLIHGWQNNSGAWEYKEEFGESAGYQWIDGYWIDPDGYCRYAPTAKWYQDSKGWYYMDSSGYYPKDEYVMIDHKNYYFNNEGYLASYTDFKFTNEKKNVKLTLHIKNKEQLKIDLNYVLSLYMNESTSKNIRINGENVKVTKKSDLFYLDNMQTDKYIDKATSDIVVSFDICDPLSSACIMVPISGNPTYDVSIGNVDFNLKSMNSKAPGTVGIMRIDGKEYNVILYYENTGFRVEGDVRNADWVKKLKSAGVVSVDKELHY